MRCNNYLHTDQMCIGQRDKTAKQEGVLLSQGTPPLNFPTNLTRLKVERFLVMEDRPGKEGEQFSIQLQICIGYVESIEEFRNFLAGLLVECTGNIQTRPLFEGIFLMYGAHSDKPISL